MNSSAGDQTQKLLKHRYSFPENTQYLKQYVSLLGEKVIEDLTRKASRSKIRKTVDVNSTFNGGGVATLNKGILPLLREIGIDTEWYKINGDESFYETTKSFHNALQGKYTEDVVSKIHHYKYFWNNGGGRMNKVLIDYLSNLPEDAALLIHDPQPIFLAHYVDRPKTWRIHIDTTQPEENMKNYVFELATKYNSIITTRPEFIGRHLPNYERVFSLSPAIDPFSDTNADMEYVEVIDRIKDMGISLERPVITQVSRLDPWKGQLELLDAYKILRSEFNADIQLALMYEPADDDPEGDLIYNLIQEKIGDDDFKKIKNGIYLLLGTDKRDVNAIQRHSNVIVQNSIREGFGLVVAEALWKGAPVVTNNVGGINLQVIDGITGYLIEPYKVDMFANPLDPIDFKRHTFQLAAKINYVLNHPDEAKRVGRNGKEHVKNNFLAPQIASALLDIINSGLR